MPVGLHKHEKITELHLEVTRLRRVVSFFGFGVAMITLLNNVMSQYQLKSHVNFLKKIFFPMSQDAFRVPSKLGLIHGEFTSIVVFLLQIGSLGTL